MGLVSAECEQDFSTDESIQSSANHQRQTLCEICSKDSSKYKCPKCLMQTCSLPCVKEHKKIKNCDGVRCKTAFVSMSDFNESHLLSDYRLLEEIGRLCDNNERELQQSTSSMTKWMHIQKNEARKMNINLKLAPKTFSMHKENSTVFITKKKSFHWHLIWHFPSIEVSVSNRRVPDAATVFEALMEGCKEDAERMPDMLPYLDENCLVFMKRQDFPSNQEKYHMIDTRKAIKEVLRGKTIIEYPQFIVVHPSEAEEYKNKVTDEVSPYSNYETTGTSFHKRQHYQTSYGRGNRRRKFRRFNANARPTREGQNHDSKVHLTRSLEHNAADTFP